MNSRTEKVNGKRWSKAAAPRRILIIRLHAMGDTIITLPWVASLKRQLPDAHLHLLVLKENADVPRNLPLFDRVFELGGTFNAKAQFISANCLLPRLLANRYEIVIDLQRNAISRWIRFLLFPSAWSEIERFSNRLAGEKFKEGIEAAGLGNVEIETRLPVRTDKSELLLKESGWNGTDDLVILNPAGAFATRNWPLANYIGFAHLWLHHRPDSKFLFLGIERLKQNARIISDALGQGKVIDLISKLTPSESFSVIRHAKVVISEDSGLMHMAWVQQIPTLGIFGSSPSYWSGPMGFWTRCLNSSDLPCGDCFLSTCRFGDVHCLTRFSSQYVFDQVKELLTAVGK